MRAAATTPAEPVGACVARFPTDGSLPRFRGGSASALSVSGPARRLLTLRPAWSLSRPWRPVTSECFRRCRYLHHPLRLLPAGTTVAGRDSHPLKNGAFPRRTRNDTLSLDGPLFAPSKPCLRVHDKHFFVVNRCVTRSRCRFWRKIFPTTPQYLFTRKRAGEAFFRLSDDPITPCASARAQGKIGDRCTEDQHYRMLGLNLLVGKRDADLPLACHSALFRNRPHKDSDESVRGNKCFH